MTQFVGLHIHSDYSLLDGASQLPDLIDRALELGMPAIALTDHGVMYGAIELLKVCRGKNIKPIIGNEMYIINGDIEKQERRPRYHQVVLAKNNQGYKNLVKLTTISNLKGLQGKGIGCRPCINKDLLKEYCEGLIVTSACLGGEVPQAILAGKLEAARKVASWYKEVFKDDYYLEIQDHGSPEDRVVNVEIVRIAQELEIKIVATNDSHFVSCNDVEAHDALLCIQTNKLISEEKRLRYSGTEYLKSASQMRQLFRDHLEDEVIEQAIANTLEVANKVQPYTIMGEPRLPDYQVPSGHTADTYLEQEAWRGVLERLKCRSRNEVDPIYKERLEYELKMIQHMGFSTYFLVVWDYIKFARDSKIPVGPGRGSAAGSLVAYALKITNIDPVHHGLLFERFLNPERKSMPDIDTDFCPERREEVIKYVTRTYGENKVAQIITFNRMTSKAVLKDVARTLGVSYADSDRMAKLIPVSRGKPAKLKEMISEQSPDPKFKQAYENETVKIYDDRKQEIGQISVRRWVDMAMRIEGTNKTFGVHAAGVVISAEPLDEIVPLQKNNEGAVITQYFMEDIESMGLLKMDFLGLKNLTILEKAIELIKQNKNIDIDPDEITAEERYGQKILAKGTVKKLPDQVQKTFEVIERGDLEGIFQIESSGMRDIVQRLKPSNIEDLSSILALYRPGPLDAGLIPQFIDRKHGREPIEYQHPLLEPILNETYAVLVYQEQIMKLAQDLAGYSLGQADLLRRSMGKKKPEEMQKHREIFIDGSARNGIKRSLAENLFEQMLKFAEYCFNKSHSTAYAYVTYQTAFLKANYTTEYMAALLTANSGDGDKVKKYIDSCQKMNITVEQPDINRSEIDFTPQGNSILFGLSAVQNLGEKAIAAILSTRKEKGAFKCLADLCDRTDSRTVNRRVLEALIKSGAFDTIEPNRNQLIHDLDLVISWAQDRAKDKAVGQLNLFDYNANNSNNSTATPAYESAPKHPPVPDFSTKEKLQMEKELLGFYVSEHPLKSARKAALIVAPTCINLSGISEQKDKSKISAIAIITAIKNVLTKESREPMAILQLEDLSGSVEAVVFPKTYDRVQSHLINDARLIVWGKVDKQEERTQIIVEDIEAIETIQMVIVEFAPQEVSNYQLERLQALLQEQRGQAEKAKVPVVLCVSNSSQRQLFRLDSTHWVQDAQAAAAALNSYNFQARTKPLLVHG
jgi:DNA polymerase III subunit alpha